MSIIFPHAEYVLNPASYNKRQAREAERRRLDPPDRRNRKRVDAEVEAAVVVDEPHPELTARLHHGQVENFHDQDEGFPPSLEERWAGISGGVFA